MARCQCGHTFFDIRYLNRHKKQCPAVKEAARSAFRLAQQQVNRPPEKKRRLNPAQYVLRMFHDAPGDAGDAEIHTVPGGIDDNPPTFTTRSGRQTRRTWRLEDVLPEAAGVEEEEPPEPPASSGRRVVLLVTEHLRTVANRFGVRRFYRRRPSQKPTNETFDLNSHYISSTHSVSATNSKRKIEDILFPFPNLTSWLLSHHHWVKGGKKTRGDRRALQDLLTRDDFDSKSLRNIDIDKLERQLAAGEGMMPWEVERDGWTQSSVIIGIPTGQKSTQASRRATAAQQQRINRHESDKDIPAEEPIPGIPFKVDGFWHKSLCAEIKKTLSSDPAAKNFVYDPYYLEYLEAGSDKPAERVHGELYNSASFVDADIRLQNSPCEPGCNLPRAIAGLMFWSDATLVAQFGQAKVWPAYMYFGNQSKYERARPTSHAAHHVGYFPSLPDDIQEFVQKNSGGKAANAALITHCRRELYQGAWSIMLDDEFVEAYHHGIVVDCMDGIRRRIYPRIFVYSADYPEKALIATIRDKGGCPCPRCLVTFDDIPALGTDSDRQVRLKTCRVDNDARRSIVETARHLVYHDGYVVNSTHVDDILKPQSLVPTTNAFSARLSSLGLDFHNLLAVDLMHEFELGVWKSVFLHLIRLIEAYDASKIHELDARFRMVSPFAGVRRFTANVSDMRRIAARDYEDILQCAIPCFEGLLPEPHDSSVMSLLYVLAYWHGLAKMRMHTDTTLAILDNATTVLGAHLRHFAAVTARAYETKETEREYAARLRAEARQASSGGVSGGSSSTGRRPRTYHMRTIKTHFLGDYAPYIRVTGTTDSYTTQTAEHEHRRTKARHARTNHRGSDAQIVNIDVLESRLRIMGHELQEAGVDVPRECDTQTTHAPVSVGEIVDSREHHRIASEQANIVDLYDWLSDKRDDLSLKEFIPDLKHHIFSRLCPDAIEDESRNIIFHNSRIYQHATARINYTTYDLQRDQDVIHPSASRCGILVHTRPEDPTAFPWMYAWVLGVYHAQVYCPGLSGLQRIEFLWVRWMEQDKSWQSGAHVLRLERVNFPQGLSESMGFVDPAHIIRGCHLIPAFNHGRSSGDISSSILHNSTGSWQYYYVNRFVDRDSMVRYLGTGIGHSHLKSPIIETHMVAPDDIDNQSLSIVQQLDGSNDDNEDEVEDTPAGDDLNDIEALSEDIRL